MIFVLMPLFLVLYQVQQEEKKKAACSQQRTIGTEEGRLDAQWAKLAYF